MENKEIFLKSIKDAQKWMKLSRDFAHNTEHIRSVIKTALQICKKINYKDTLKIKAICCWHDVGRLFSPIHEELSAQMAKYNLLGHGADEDTADVFYNGIRFHKWNMKPKTLEGRILKDADKLDFISINRWKKCIKNNELEHIIPMVKLIPELRKFLELNASRQIYEIRIKEFNKYIKTDKKLKEKRVGSLFKN